MKIPTATKNLLEDWKPKLICLALAVLVWVVVKREVNVSHEIYRLFRTQEMLLPNQALDIPSPPTPSPASLSLPPATAASRETPPAPAHASLPLSP